MMNLFHAAEEGDLERVEDLVKQGVDKDEKSGGYTPLDVASRNGFVLFFVTWCGMSTDQVHGLLS